jgi:hypothetical protein
MLKEIARRSAVAISRSSIRCMSDGGEQPQLVITPEARSFTFAKIIRLHRHLHAMRLNRGLATVCRALARVALIL